MGTAPDRASEVVDLDTEAVLDLAAGPVLVAGEAGAKLYDRSR
jgi:hypothetical protein